MTLSNVCVFCGSSNGSKSIYADLAYSFGHLLAEAGIRLIYGGGNAGLMGQVARGALDHGGKVTGIIPEFLINKERIGDSLDELDEVIVTTDMHERKMKMFEKSDAFVALPGGIGTLEELVEQLTWSQLGQHQKPIVVADFDGFWSPFFELVDHMKDQAFIGGNLDVTFGRVESAEEILPLLFEIAENPSKPKEPVVTDIQSQL